MSYFTSYPPGKNGRHFADDIFKCIFVNEKFCILIKISLKFVLGVSNWQEPNVCLENSLGPNRREAIIWTNTDPIHWRIYAALGGGELILFLGYRHQYLFHCDFHYEIKLSKNYIFSFKSIFASAFLFAIKHTHTHVKSSFKWNYHKREQVGDKTQSSYNWSQYPENRLQFSRPLTSGKPAVYLLECRLRLEHVEFKGAKICASKPPIGGCPLRSEFYQLPTVTPMVSKAIWFGCSHYQSVTRFKLRKV